MSLTPLRDNRLTKALISIPEKFGEAYLPCLYFMVEGNLSAITFKKLVVAYNTGMKTAVVYSLCCLLFNNTSIFVSAFLTGVITFICDLYTHPTHFGHWWTEAAATGISASLLSLIFHVTVVRMKRRN